MPSFKKLALIATEIYGKTSAEMAETATEPKTIPPAVFKNGREVRRSIRKILHWLVIRMPEAKTRRTETTFQTDKSEFYISVNENPRQVDIET